MLLQQGLANLRLDADERKIEALLQFITLLDKWNKTYNLTSIRDPEMMITRHLLDSLAVIPYIKGPWLLDVGTGAGLPGIPLAIMRPELNWLLLDSNGKKTRFVTQVVTELGLDNVQVSRCRVAELSLEVRCNTVISRAFSDLKTFIDGAAHLCMEDGQLLAMKGVMLASELESLPAEYQVSQFSLQVPGLAEQRCIIRIEHK